MLLAVHFFLNGMVRLLTALVHGCDVQNASLRLSQWAFCSLLAGLAYVAL